MTSSRECGRAGGNKYSQLLGQKKLCHTLWEWGRWGVLGLSLLATGCVSDEILNQYDDDVEAPLEVTHLPAKQVMILSVTTPSGFPGPHVSLVWQEQVADSPELLIEHGVACNFKEGLALLVVGKHGKKYIQPNSLCSGGAVKEPSFPGEQK